MTVRTRFAPSPTGYLHIGGVRTAWFNWLLARQAGGQFILRIDDTDQQRNVEAALKPILDGFRWLGIDWDEGPEVGGDSGPYYQSQRTEFYVTAVEQLLESGHAYWDYATPEELHAQRGDAQAAKRDFVYNREWMATTPEERAEFESQGRKAVIRLKMPREGVCAFHDHIRGDMTFDWAREQDHVIRRADGTFIYHLASVVDDHAMNITHVVRAEEHLSNTPRQIFIAQSLGYDLPEYAHLPQVAEPGSKHKLSKRKLAKYLKNREFKQLCEHGQRIMARLGRETSDESFNPVLIDFYSQTGFLADAIINYLMLLGWSLDDKTEDFSREEMIEHFSLARVNKAPASFNPQKLMTFQERAMQRLSISERAALTEPFLRETGLIREGDSQSKAVEAIVAAAGDRLKVAGDILDYAYLLVADETLEYDEKAFKKRLQAPGATELLAKFQTCLAQVEPFDVTTIEIALKQFVADEEIKIGQIIHAIRVAITGQAVGPGLFDCLAILGKESSLARIDQAIKKV